jgi:hypothetical protein
MNQKTEVKDLIGKTLTNVEQIKVYEIIFTTDKGERYKLYHEQDCCEKVEIEDVVGKLSNLVGVPILVAEESTSQKMPDDILEKYKAHANNKFYEFTWTFYKFATIKGYVDIRWYGLSNGYYSESVDFVLIKD